MTNITKEIASLTSAQRELIGRLLKKEGIQVQSKQITPLGRESNIFRPSFAQQRLWLVHQLEPDSPAYNLHKALKLSGALNTNALERSLNEIVKRHETLRTTFTVRDGSPVQVIATGRPFALPVLDVKGLTEHQRRKEVLRLANAEAREGFDLSKGPLLRTKLLKLGDEEHVLLVTMHHVISDAWSMGIFMAELSKLYSSFAAGLNSPLVLPAIQYADFAQWQRDWLEQGELLKQLSYWKSQLAGAPHALELLTDRPRPLLKSYRGSREFLRFGKALTSSFKDFTRRQGATFFMGLLAAFNTLLYRYSGEEDLVIGTPIANRNRFETEELIGFFVNTLVIRTNLYGNPSFTELLARQMDVALGAYANQDVPFEKLVEELAPQRDLSRTPLFQIMFALQNEPKQQTHMHALSITPLSVDSGTAKFDLALYLWDAKDHLQGFIEYNSDLFEPATIQRMIAHYERLLESIVKGPHKKIRDLDMLGEQETTELLENWNQTRREYVSPALIHELFERQAEKSPQSVAVVCDDQSVTYDELNRRTNQLAHYLIKRGAAPETLIGICLERSIDMVVAMLGVLKAGAAYLPLDLSNPKKRLLEILNDGQVKLLVSTQSQIEGIDYPCRQIIAIDTAAEEISSAGRANPRTATSTQNLAYVIYTSGSTGKPKGVAVEHRQVVNYINAVCERLEFPHGSSYGVVSTLAADLCLTMVYPSLSSGGQLHIISRERASDGQRLAEYLSRHNIECLKIVPSHLEALLGDKYLTSLLPAKRLVLGGEASRWELVCRLNELGSGCKIYNHYGPTETTIGVLINEVDQLESARRGPLELGRPIGNIRAYILGEAQELAAIGAAGELYISGEGLARGYLNRPELTAERFLPNPFSSTPGQRIYRTGDLVRYTEEGKIAYIGRADHQVKIRGYRIETGEVEAALKILGLKEAVVIVKDERADKRLIAFIVEHQTNTSQPKDLKKKLRDILPDYMIPSEIVKLQEIPLTPNGKINRRALEEHVLIQQCDLEFKEPRDPLEEIVAGIWKVVLKKDHLSIDHNFFDIGGHSLLATQVVSRLRETFKLEIPLRSAFEMPTIQSQAQFIQQELAIGTTIAEERIKVRSPDGIQKLSYGQERLWFIDQLEGGGASYNIARAIVMDGGLNLHAIREALREIVRRHEVLRTRFDVNNGEPVQLFDQFMNLEIPVNDLEAETTDQAIENARQFAALEATKGFDLHSGPLIRAMLLRISARLHVLVIVMHHIVSDGWSSGILLRELSILYEAFSHRKESPLNDLEIQYADYASWQRNYLTGELIQQQLKYWRNHLLGAPLDLDLPLDRLRTDGRSRKGAQTQVTINKDVTEKLKRLTAREGATLFMTLLAGFNTLLSRYSGQEDIVIGTPIANRNRVQTENLIGFLVNTLVMRTDLSGDPTFRELINRQREIALAAYANQDVPFEKLVEELQPTRDLSRTPLFQVMFTLQNAPREPLKLRDLKLQYWVLGGGTAKFDLDLTLVDTPAGVSGWLEYDSDLFNESTIEKMIGHYTRLLESIAEDPDKKISELEMLGEAEKNQILVEWNQTAAEYPLQQPMSQLFEEQVRRSPSARAAGCYDQNLSYEELNVRANRLAHYLREQGAGPESLIGIAMHRSLDFLTSVLACFKAGAAYLPLDPLDPPHRLSLILDDSNPLIVLSDDALLGRIDRIRHRLVFVEEIASEIQSRPCSDLPVTASPDNLAYLIYTSGSTGKPKGAMITQRGMLNHLFAKIGDLAITGEDIIAQNASQCFDISVWQMLAGLLVGASVQIIPNKESRDPEALIEQVSAHRITILEVVPAMLRAMIESLEEGNSRRGARMDKLRWVVATGEALEASLCRQWLQLRPGVKIMNAYGPTECSDDVTHEVIREVPSAGTRYSSIGGPLANTRIYILGKRQTILPVGVAGEIYVGGEGVGRGYLGESARTAEVFVADSFSAEGGRRLYKTGDIGKWRSDGRIDYLGRRDEQVKVRGYRIELGEIEAAISQHRAIRQCVVIVRQQQSGARLVAYVVLNDSQAEQVETATGQIHRAEVEGDRMLIDEMRRDLRDKLPEYMQPSAVVVLKEMPLTANGKVDRRALQARPEEEMEAASHYVAPRNDIEKQLVEIWQEVLGVEQIGVTDNFFELGGHSLKATQVLSRLRRRFDIQFALRKLFEEQTIEGLSKEVVAAMVAGEEDLVVAQMLEELEAMSENEVKTLLQAQE